MWTNFVRRSSAFRIAYIHLSPALRNRPSGILKLLLSNPFSVKKNRSRVVHFQHCSHQNQRNSWGVLSTSSECFHAVLRSEEHTSELQSLRHLVCRLLLEKKK